MYNSWREEIILYKSIVLNSFYILIIRVKCLPTDNQLNDNALLLSGSYGSNYADFRPSGEGGVFWEDGIDGFIIPISKPDVWIERIKLVAQSNELRQLIGKRARRKSESFSANNMAKYYAELYYNTLVR